MHYIQVIREAWELTTSSPKLKWFVFVPSFAAVIVFMAEIAWQGSLLSQEFGLVEQGFVYDTAKSFLTFLSNHHLLGWGIFMTIFIILFEFVLASWITATLILSVRQKFNAPEKQLSVRQKMIEGASYFFKIFEFHALFSPFALMTIILFTGTMFRYYHGEIFSTFLMPIIVVYFIASFFINTFTAFAPYFIICDKLGLSDSIKKSIGLVFLNFGTTMGVILIMFLVNLRIIVNVLVVIGVPMGILFALSYFAQSAWLGVAVTLVAIIGIILLALTAYLTAIVQVFSTAVWERTFTFLTSHQRDLVKAAEEADEVAKEVKVEGPDDVNDEFLE